MLYMNRRYDDLDAFSPLLLFCFSHSPLSNQELDCVFKQQEEQEDDDDVREGLASLCSSPSFSSFSSLFLSSLLLPWSFHYLKREQAEMALVFPSSLNYSLSSYYSYYSCHIIVTSLWSLWFDVKEDGDSISPFLCSSHLQVFSLLFSLHLLMLLMVH